MVLFYKATFVMTETQESNLRRLQNKPRAMEKVSQTAKKVSGNIMYLTSRNIKANKVQLCKAQEAMFDFESFIRSHSIACHHISIFK